MIAIPALSARRQILLGGISLLGVTASWMAPFPAFAACPITTNVSGPVSVTSDCSITSSGTISGGETGIVSSGAYGTLSNSGSVTGYEDGLDNSAMLGMLDNSGAFSGIYFGGGLNNSGSIGTITNSTGGKFTGAYYGILNSGGITTLSNIGLISNVSGFGGGTMAALYNNSSGTIGSLSNSGSIVSSASTALHNLGTITALSNTGLIQSSYGIALVNDGLLASFSNSGTVSSVHTGIANDGTITALSNTGVVSASSGIGLFNDGLISSFSNSGIVSGPMGGVKTLGTLTLVDNSGTITGEESGTGLITAYGFTNDGTMGTVTNSGEISATTSLTSGAGTLQSTGFDNTGQITEFFNSGEISAAASIISGDGAFSVYGLENSGTIGSFINGGTVTAFVLGAGGGESNPTNAIYNSGEIDQLVNQADGLISGTTAAINNSGTILTLSNAGIIAHTNTLINTLANFPVIENSGTIGTYTNTGTILGVAFDDVGVTSLLVNGTDGVLQIIELDQTGMLTSLQNAGTIGEVYNQGTIDVLSNLSTGSFGADSPVGILNIDVLHSLVNAGLIAGGIDGVVNLPSASIDLLLNDGVIAGNTSGLINIGGIALLQNNGLLTGMNGAALLNIGTITTLANTGLIDNSPTVAVANQGTIGFLDNSGSISGDSGIVNTGSLSALSNDGLISGTVIAIQNTASIGTLLNTNMIVGGATGLQNSGNIASIVNSGVITGTTFGIANSGTIGGILNTGTISGRTGLDLSTGSATLVNSGTIIGTGGTAILTGGNDDLIFTTGSDVEGVINGMTAASAIQLQGQGQLSTDILNFASGSALDINPGADWSAEGSWALDQVTNDGIFRPGMQNGSIGTPLSITGNFAQNADGMLEVAITPDENSALIVSGNASLDGAINYDFAPGIYNSHTYAVLTSGTLTGQFATETYTATGISKSLTLSTVYLTDPGVDLVLSEASTTSSGTISSGATTTGGLPPALVVPVPDAALFSAQRQALAEDANADTGLLLDQAASGLQGGARADACASAALAQRDTVGSRTAQLASELANGFCAAGGWIAATGDLFNASASDGAAGYNANTGGFLAGIDKQIGAGPRLGFAIGYDNTSLNERGAGSASTGVVRVGLYGAQQIGRLTLTGVFDYGSANGNVSRAAGISDFKSDDSANVFAGGMQAATTVTLGSVAFTPQAGLRFASVSGGHFAEGAGPALAAFAVHGTGPGYVSTQPYVALQLGQSLLTTSGLDVGTHLRAGYQYEAGDNGVRTDSETQDGSILASDRNALARSAAVLGAGISAGKNNWSLYINYSGHVASNWNDQTGEFGVKVIF